MVDGGALSGLVGLVIVEACLLACCSSRGRTVVERIVVLRRVCVSNQAGRALGMGLAGECEPVKVRRSQVLVRKDAKDMVKRERRACRGAWQVASASCFRGRQALSSITKLLPLIPCSKRLSLACCHLCSHTSRASHAPPALSQVRLERRLRKETEAWSSKQREARRLRIISINPRRAPPQATLAPCRLPPPAPPAPSAVLREDL